MSKLLLVVSVLVLVLLLFLLLLVLLGLSGELAAESGSADAVAAVQACNIE